MKTLLILATLLVTLLILAFEITNSEQLDAIEDHILQVYNNDCLYCSRRGIVDAMDT
jgi:hypothetical protein